MKFWCTESFLKVTWQHTLKLKIHIAIRGIPVEIKVHEVTCMWKLLQYSLKTNKKQLENNVHLHHEMSGSIAAYPYSRLLYCYLKYWIKTLRTELDVFHEVLRYHDADICVQFNEMVIKSVVIKINIILIYIDMYSYLYCICKDADYVLLVILKTENVAFMGLRGGRRGRPNKN